MIRKFYLENVYGEKYYFNLSNNTLLTEINGLGFTLDMKYLKYNNVYKRYDATTPLLEVKEKVIFLDGYNGYKRFVDFLSISNKNMKLYYETKVFKAYCYVEISHLSKGELVSSTIQSSIVFKKLSLWINEKDYEVIANGTISGKVYPYTYPFSYSSSYAGKINISNEGNEKAPLVITIEGDVVEPEILIKRNNEVVSSLRLYITDNDIKITINAFPSNQEITMIKDGVETDIYSEQDFTEDNFIFLDHGDYEIEFKPGVSTTTTCKIKVIEGYLGI